MRQFISHDTYGIVEYTYTYGVGWYGIVTYVYVHVHLRENGRAWVSGRLIKLPATG